MSKWEYKVIDSQNVPGGGLLKGKDREKVEEYLNELGTAGWEIVNIDFYDQLAHQYDFVGVAKRKQS